MSSRPEHKTDFFRHIYSACGTPSDEWVRIEGHEFKQCPSCWKLRDKKRKCLACGAPITPGCKIGWHCAPCGDYNARYSEYEVQHKIIIDKGGARR